MATRLEELRAALARAAKHANTHPGNVTAARALKSAREEYAAARLEADIDRSPLSNDGARRVALAALSAGRASLRSAA